MPDAATPGFFRTELDPSGAERLVLRFSQADFSASAAEGATVKLEFHLRGPGEALGSWNPSLRRVEGLLVLGEPEGPVEVGEVKLRLPAAIRDLEIHTRSGDIEVRAGRLGLLLESEAGHIRAEGAQSVEAVTQAGDIEIEDAAVAELRSVSGKLSCAKTAERLVIRSGSGDIDIEECRAAITVETKSGEVSITRSTGRVMVQTQSGDVELEAASPFGGGDIETATGHINLSLERCDVELRSETLSGKLRGPQGEVGSPAGPRRLVLSVGKGGRRLHARSVSGDIEISY